MSSAVALSIDDETGRAHVFASRPTLVLRVDHEDQSDGLCPASPRARALLAEHGISPEGRALWYREGILRVGERVSVLGHGRWEAEPDPSEVRSTGYREPPRRLILKEPRDGSLILSSDSG